MLYYLVTKRAKNQGFTLLEMLVTLTAVGILTAMTVPNLLSWYNQNQVKAGIEIVASTFQEVKLQAQRQSKSCTIILNSTGITTNNTGCLSSSRNLPNNVTLATNIVGTPPAVTFSHKGNPIGLTTNEPTVNIGVVVVSMTNGTNKQQCLLISDGLGMIRKGIYQGNISTITQDKCVVQ